MVNFQRHWKNSATDEAAKEHVKRVIHTTLAHKEHNQPDLSAVSDVQQFSQEIKLYRVPVYVTQLLTTLKSGRSKVSHMKGELTSQEIRVAKRMWLLGMQAMLGTKRQECNESHSLRFHSV